MKGIAADIKKVDTVFKKWATPGLFLFIFVIFSIQFQSYKLKNAWDSNLGPQDGRRRRNHGAMAATLVEPVFILRQVNY